MPLNSAVQHRNLARVDNIIENLQYSSCVQYEIAFLDFYWKSGYMTYIYGYPYFHRYLPWPSFLFDFGGQGDLIQQPNLMGC